MSSPRVIYAVFHLLDRQLVDAEGRLCGKVDDVELERVPETGQLHAAAVLSGPGVLAGRLGGRRLGAWLERMAAAAMPAKRDHPARIAFGRVTEVGSHVELAARHDELATFAAERWVRDHLTGHIPGSRRAAQ